MRFWMCLLILIFAGSSASMAAARKETVSSLPQWQDFQARQNQSLTALSTCIANIAACDSKETERWAGLVNGLSAQNKLRQIITVNRWFNRLPYTYDEYAYNSVDYWADTRELLTKRGDCEDFALSKYYTLRQLGFTPDQLKIMVVFDTMNNTNHAVLMVYMDGARHMLDIYSDGTDPFEMDNRYRPIYGFNEQTAWFY